MYIQFYHRTIGQLYTAWYQLVEKYKCRVQIVKKLVSGLWNGYIVINREIKDSSIPDYIQAHEKYRAITATTRARKDNIGSNYRATEALLRHFHIPPFQVNSSLINLQKTKSQLIKQVKIQKYGTT